MRRRIIQKILRILAKITIWRYRPEIIGITGSMGKSSAKEAIYHTLKAKFKVRRSAGNYNNEVGAPLAILGLKGGGSSALAWLAVFLKAILVIIWDRNYPDILILEMGVDKPGDMEYLLDFIPVEVGVFTAVGEFPSHIEFFPEKDSLLKEKARLIKSLPGDGLAVLNYDDSSVRLVGGELNKKIKTIYYGFGQGADLRIVEYGLRLADLDKGDFGAGFKIDYQGSVVPFRLNRVLSKQQVFAAAAAAAVGSFFNMNLVEISQALSGYRSLAGRTNLIKGINGSWLIDDSYNASPMATVAALDVLEETAEQAKSKRKIAVLGDMLELGKYSEPGHQAVGRKAASAADLLFSVGEKSQITAVAAEEEGMEHNLVFRFSNSEEAAKALKGIIKQGDIILIKGSRAMKMEKITREIMAEPQKAKELLVH